MYIEIAERNNKSIYVNSDHIKCIQFNKELSKVDIWMTDNEQFTIDYNLTFAYPARKINYQSQVKLRQLVGLPLDDEFEI